MNTASQDLPRHLGLLKQKLQHGTDYETALYYFLEEFAGDVAFMDQSQPETALNLVAVLEHVASTALGKPSQLQQPRVLRLAEYRFMHGNAAAGGRVLLFFYFEDADTGLMAMMPGNQGAAEIARFRLTSGLPGNPTHN